MKQSVIIIMVLAFSLFACAQTPPKSVTDNFNSKFSGATKVKWEQEEENEWEAEFKMKGSEMSACFNNAGEWMTTEIEIKEKDLPMKVAQAVKKTYDGWKIESVESIETRDFKGYELGIEKGNEELEIMVTSNGEITVNKESGEEDDDD
jgi:hypothetical protein